jgi:hypothetical protein
LDFVEVLEEGTFPTIDKLDSELTSNIFSIPSRILIYPHSQESRVTLYISIPLAITSDSASPDLCRNST